MRGVVVGVAMVVSMAAFVSGCSGAGGGGPGGGGSIPVGQLAAE